MDIKAFPEEFKTIKKEYQKSHLRLQEIKNSSFLILFGLFWHFFSTSKGGGGGRRPPPPLEVAKKCKKSQKRIPKESFSNS